MKILWTLLLIAGALRAEDLHVYVSDHAGVAPAILQFAQAEAAWMFGRIGVAIRWHWGRPPANFAGRAVQIDFSARTPLQEHPGALAFAQPFGNGLPAITVLYDRVRFTAERQPGLESRLLAHVLAHEIGHVLAATDHHSESGVMKAHWTSEDYGRMVRAPLPFTALDRALIAERLTASR
jgi:hypothetical protein